MELKTARLTLLIDPNKKVAFEHLCAMQDRTASQVVRQLIREYLVAHGVEYVGSGTDEPAEAAPAGPPARADRKAARQPSARTAPRKKTGKG